MAHIKNIELRSEIRLCNEHSSKPGEGVDGRIHRIIKGRLDRFDVTGDVLVVLYANMERNLW